MWHFGFVSYGVFLYFHLMWWNDGLSREYISETTLSLIFDKLTPIDSLHCRKFVTWWHACDKLEEERHKFMTIETNDGCRSWQKFKIFVLICAHEPVIGAIAKHFWGKNGDERINIRYFSNSNCRLVWQLLSISYFCLLKFVIRGVLLWTLQRHGPWLNDLGRLIPAKSRFNETGNHNFPISIDELVTLFRSIEAPTLLLFKH